MSQQQQQFHTLEEFCTQGRIPCPVKMILIGGSTAEQALEQVQSAVAAHVGGDLHLWLPGKPNNQSASAFNDAVSAWVYHGFPSGDVLLQHVSNYILKTRNMSASRGPPSGAQNLNWT